MYACAFLTVTWYILFQLCLDNKVTVFCSAHCETEIIHCKQFPVLMLEKQHKHKPHSWLQTLINMFLMEFKSIHKYVGAIYYKLACSMMDVFVDSCKETAYGHHLCSFAQAIFCRYMFS